MDNIKSIRGKQFVTVDSCYYNAGEICKFKEVPYRVVHSAGSVNANYSSGITDIMGYTCLEQDCLYHDFKELVSVSDILLFGGLFNRIKTTVYPTGLPNVVLFARWHD